MDKNNHKMLGCVSIKFLISSLSLSPFPFGGIIASDLHVPASSVFPIYITCDRVTLVSSGMSH